MKTSIIIEDREFITDLERLQNKFESYQSLLSYMINSDIDIQSDSFKNYQKEYEEVYKAFLDKKRMVERIFVRPIISHPKSWNLIFETGELIIDD